MKFLDMPSLGRLTSILTDCTLGDQMLDGRIEAFSCKKAGDDKRLSKSLNEKLQKKRKRSRCESINVNNIPSSDLNATCNQPSNGMLSGAAALAAGDTSDTAKKELTANTTNFGDKVDHRTTTTTNKTSVINNADGSNKRPRSTSFLFRQKMSRQTSSHSFEQSLAPPIKTHASDLSVDGSKTSSMDPLENQKERKIIIDFISTLNAMYDDYDFSESLSEQFVKHSSINDIIPIVNKNLAEVMELRVEGFLNQLWSEVDKAIQVRNCSVYSYLPADGDPFCGDGVMWSFNYFFYNHDLHRILCFSCIARSKWSYTSGRRTPGALKNGLGRIDNGENGTPSGSPLPSPSTTPGGSSSSDGFRNNNSPFNYGHFSKNSSSQEDQRGSPNGGADFHIVACDDDDEIEAYDVADRSGDDEEI
jgi:hypothetical protein